MSRRGCANTGLGPLLVSWVAGDAAGAVGATVAARANRGKPHAQANTALAWAYSMLAGSAIAFLATARPWKDSC